MNFLHVDLETRSHHNLLVEGSYRYADPEQTDILICCYALDDGEIHTWLPESEPLPSHLAEMLVDGPLIAAHNARFERLILNRVGAKYGFPPTPIERYYCTMYQMAVNNIPMSLDDAGRALKTHARKDPRGRQLIKLLSNPNEDGTFNEDPELMQEFIDYCRQDVETERAIMHVTRQVSTAELADYWVLEHINDAGILIDADLARAAVKLSDLVAEQAEARVAELTSGAVLKPRGPTITTWVYDRLTTERQRGLMTKQVKDPDSGEFETKITLDRNAREALLTDDDLPALVRQVVNVAESVGSGSVAKFQAMLNAMESDYRVRGSYTCSGAPATGRYSARQVQMHNFSRDTYKDPEPVIAEFLRTGDLPDEPMLALKRLLRPALCTPPGKTFVCSDWAAIEGRALPWLTLDPDCDAKLELFRKNEDVYLVTATGIYGEPVTEKTDPRRQVGKVAELALGYQGAGNSFKVMGANYGVYVPESEVVHIVRRWRQANPGIERFWYALENAAFRALDAPDTIIEVGRVSMLFTPQLLNGSLLIRLPSGRLLTYNNCRLEWDDRYDKPVLTSLNSTISPKFGATEWPRRSLYGGLLAENITQATCADLLRETLRALVHDGHPVVAHTHDEVLLEVPERFQRDYVEILEDYMLFTPAWAEGLPLAVESWVGKRYRK